MKIRIAVTEDMEQLGKYDLHIQRTELENSIRLNRVYVAEEEGRFLGWLRYNLFWDNTPFINMLYILEGHRGKGYGSALVARWEQDMRRLNYEMVMTSTSSDEYAQHFYYKLGYTAVGSFRHGDDPLEIILSRKLERPLGAAV